MNGHSTHQRLVYLSKIDRRAAVQIGATVGRQVLASTPLDWRERATLALEYAEKWGTYRYRNAGDVRVAAKESWVWAQRLPRTNQEFAVLACTVGRGADREDTGVGLVAEAVYAAARILGDLQVAEIVRTTETVACPPPTLPQLEQVSEEVRVAWDLVAERPAANNFDSICASRDRAQRLGLWWPNFVERAIATRAGNDIEPQLERILGQGHPDW